MQFPTKWTEPDALPHDAVCLDRYARSCETVPRFALYYCRRKGERYAVKVEGIAYPEGEGPNGQTVTP